MSQILLVVLFLGPLLLVLGLMSVWKIKIRNSDRHFPFQDKVFREPGYTLLKKREEVWDKVAQYLFFLPVYPLIMYATYLQSQVTGKNTSQFLLVLIAISMIMVTVFCLHKIWNLLSASLKLRLGYAGEVAVGQELNKLLKHGFQVFHDVPFEKEKFNVDHIAVGPSGIFSVETKLRTKREKRKNHHVRSEVSYNGKALRFSDDPAREYSQALQQASSEARAVTQWLSKATGRRIQAQPILALPGWWVNDADSKNGDVWVFNHKMLYRLAEHTQTRLNKSEIEAISYQISQRCTRDDIKPNIFE